MAVKIRLARRGRKQRPYYHIVVADARSPRDGKFIEQIGSYNPMTKPATIEIDREKAFDWLQKGAQPTDTARAILRFKGVMYRMHLQRGVAKGALTQESADAQVAEWIAAKDAKVASRFEDTRKEVEELRKMIDGTAKPKAAAPAEVSDAAAFREDVEQEAPEEIAVEETPSAEVKEEAPVVEETPVAETPVADAPEEEKPAE